MRRRSTVAPRRSGWMQTPPLLHETFTHETPDGTLRAWDVTHGMQLTCDGREQLLFPLAAHGVTTQKVESMYEGIDRQHALDADLSIPLLFIPLGDECLLLDGHHRLWKAAVLGVPELPMYLLTRAEAVRIQFLELPPGHGVDWR